MVMRSRSILLAIISLVFVSMFVVDSSWEVEHRIEISARKSTIWTLLSELENYSQWNRYSPSVEGELAVGEVVWVEAHLDNEIQRVQNIVLTVEPEQELCWQSADWYGSMARGTRCRNLYPQGQGTTLLVHHEIMEGPLAWLIELIYRERIERGIKLVDESLAQRAELITTGGSGGFTEHEKDKK
ncbi:MAG: SRPBCC domain-containing protein [Pseudomonadales bacterium]